MAIQRQMGARIERAEAALQKAADQARKICDRFDHEGISTFESMCYDLLRTLEAALTPSPSHEPGLAESKNGLSPYYRDALDEQC